MQDVELAPLDNFQSKCLQLVAFFLLAWVLQVCHLSILELTTWTGSSDPEGLVVDVLWLRAMCSVTSMVCQHDSKFYSALGRATTLTGNYDLIIID